MERPLKAKIGTSMFAGWLLLACNPAAPSDLNTVDGCQVAVDYMASCLGVTSLPVDTSCNPAEAEFLLSQTCEQIQLSADGKVDAVGLPPGFSMLVLSVIMKDDARVYAQEGLAVTIRLVGLAADSASPTIHEAVCRTDGAGMCRFAMAQTLGNYSVHIGDSAELVCSTSIAGQIPSDKVTVNRTLYVNVDPDGEPAQCAGATQCEQNAGTCLTERVCSSSSSPPIMDCPFGLLCCPN
jgi:hypothetical protein